MQNDAIEGDTEALRGKTVIEAGGAGGLDGCVEGVGDAPEGEDLVGAEEGEEEAEVGGCGVEAVGGGECECVDGGKGREGFTSWWRW